MARPSSAPSPSSSPPPSSSAPSSPSLPSSSSSPSSRASTAASVVAAAVVAVAAAWAAGLLQSPKTEPIAVEHWAQLRFPVQPPAPACPPTPPLPAPDELVWPERSEDGTVDAVDAVAPFLEAVIARARPVVVRNATGLTRAWRAFNTWSPAHLTAVLGEGFPLPRVFWGGNRTVFRFQDYTALNEYPGTPRFYDDGAVPVGDFFRMLHDPREFGYLYFAVPVEWISPRLSADVAPIGMLSPRPADASVQLWVGSVGVTTQLHYDIDYNFHVQVTGAKHFTVLPPAALAAAAVFPMPHQYYRRSQLDLGPCSGFAPAEAAGWAPSPEAAALVAIPGAVAVTLHPGDILYLPPFWLHHVVNLNAGMSLNVWTRSAGIKEATFGLWRSVPEPEIRPSSELVRLLFYRDYLTRVLLSRDASGGVRARVADHWEQRYRRLCEQGLAEPELPEDAACATEALVAPARLHRQLDVAVSATTAMAAEAAGALGPGFDTVWGDLVDLVAYTAVSRQHRRMGAFLVTCFALTP